MEAGEQSSRNYAATNFTMKTAHILVFVILLVASLDATSIGDIANEIAVIPRNEISADDLPQGLEEDVLKVLRQRNDSSTLIHLNDQKMIDKWVESYKAIEGKSFMKNLLLQHRMYAPYMIDELAPLLYIDDSLAIRTFNDESGTIDQGLSHSVALGIASIATKSPQFTEAVHRSAKEILDTHRGSDALIYTLRNWWESNEPAFRSEDYSEVEPIQIRMLADVLPNEVAPAPSVEEVAKAVEEVTAPEPVTEEPAEVVVARPSEEPAEQSSNWWLWLIGAVIVVGGLGLVIRRKS